MKYFIAFLSLILPLILLSQHDFIGYIYDLDSAVITDVNVKLIEKDYTVYTDSKGKFKLENLGIGDYTIQLTYLTTKKIVGISVPSKAKINTFYLTKDVQLDEVTIKDQIWGQREASNVEKINTINLDSPQDMPYLLSHAISLSTQSDAGNGIGYTGIRIRGIDPSHIQINLNGIPFNDAESALSFFVDIPDIASSTEDIAISRGYVASRAGAGNFGSSIDINMNKLRTKKHLLAKSNIGSYKLLRSSLLYNSGQLSNNCFLEGRLSLIRSNGYIERSNSNLKSLFLSATKLMGHSSYKVNILHGEETTGQAWNGVPEAYNYIDSLRRFNFAGSEKTAPFYNDIDHYRQSHIQFFFQTKIAKKVHFNNTINYTFGKGFYENYKSNENLSYYNISHPSESHADLIRQKWLQNNFLFTNNFIDIDLSKNLSGIVGISASYYQGHHFGKVKEVYLKDITKANTYYNNTGKKSELGAYFKLNYLLNRKLSLGFDIQNRYVQHFINGTHDVYDNLLVSHSNLLWNPKFYGNYKISPNWHLNLGLAYYEREPYRDDLLRNPNVTKEKLFSFDIGSKYINNKVNCLLNLYNMTYRDQLVLDGQINEVGEATRINVKKSFRKGIETSINYAPLKKLSLNANATLSLNKIINFIESVSVFDTDFNVIEIEKNKYSKTTIASSPSAICYVMVIYNIVNSKEFNWSISSNYKYVSLQYLDNSERKQASIPEFAIVNFESTLDHNLHRNIHLKYWLQVNNVLNKKYSTHGWIYSYKTENVVVESYDPYAQSINAFNHILKGVYPQALRNFSLGVTLMID